MFDCLIFDKFSKYAMSNNPDYTVKYLQAVSQVRHVMSDDTIKYDMYCGDIGQQERHEGRRINST